MNLGLAVRGCVWRPTVRPSGVFCPVGASDKDCPQMVEFRTHPRVRNPAATYFTLAYRVKDGGGRQWTWWEITWRLRIDCGMEATLEYQESATVCTLLQGPKFSF